MPLLYRFGEDFRTVGPNLEAAIASSQQRYAFQVVAVLIDDFLRQPGGTRAIVSLMAIYYFNLHACLPLIAVHSVLLTV